MLTTRYRVVKNKGNLNNHIGLPLSLMELRQAPDVAVMELGMNHAGEIRTLVGIADPDVRVWTNVGDAHLGHFASAEGIADAKAALDGMYKSRSSPRTRLPSLIFHPASSSSRAASRSSLRSLPEPSDTGGT